MTFDRHIQTSLQCGYSVVPCGTEWTLAFIYLLFFLSGPPECQSNYQFWEQILMNSAETCIAVIQCNCHNFTPTLACISCRFPASLPLAGRFATSSPWNHRLLRYSSPTDVWMKCVLNFHQCAEFSSACHKQKLAALPLRLIREWGPPLRNQRQTMNHILSAFYKVSLFQNIWLSSDHSDAFGLTRRFILGSTLNASLTAARVRTRASC